jgi:hypothetical protein
MMRRSVTKSSVPCFLDSVRPRQRPSKTVSVGLARFLAILALGSLSIAPPAKADEGCTLRGEVSLPESVAVYDGATGGREIAHFTGAKVELSVSSFPDSSSGRAVIETSGFRIKGFARARDLPVYTARSVPVSAGHVWIGEGRRVAIIGGAPGRLHAERALASPLSGNFQGWAPCEAFTLTERVPSGWSPPGGARGYVMARERISLYSAPRGDVVTSIERAGGGPSVLLWSMDREGSWVHVVRHADVLLDAWAKAEDVSPLPPGETMDQLAPSTSVPGTPRIVAQGQSKTVRVASPVSIRIGASDTAGVIGGVDAGVEIMVLDTVAGWASVVPKALTVAPSGSLQFWVRTKELGL